MLHQKCKTSISYKLFCEEGDEVPKSEIAFGYKLKGHDYLVFDKKEIASAKPVPYLANSSRIEFSNVYLIPVAALNLLRSIVPPLLTNIHRIRSRRDCERLVISRIATNV